jgi:hypothetical protein
MPRIRKSKFQYVKPRISSYSLNPKLNQSRFLQESEKFNLLAADWVGEPGY